MTCSKASQLLSAYSDSELSGSDMIAIQNHLRKCPTCQEELSAIRAIKSYAGIEVPMPPMGFEEQLVQSVENAVSAPMLPRARFGFVHRMGYGVALVAVCLAVGLFVKTASTPSVAHDTNTRVFQSPDVPVPTRETAKVNTKTPAYGAVGREIQSDREFVDGSDPLSGTAVAVAYADR